jgi:hypothetical protein
MKKVFITILASLILVIAFSSCKKIIAKVYGGTDISVPQVQLTIPTVFAVTANEISLGTYSYSFNLDSAVRANTSGVFGANAVNSIKIKQVIINITNPDQLNNLSNFQTARVTLQSNTNNTPTELFTINFADSYAASYTYTTTSSPELLSYLKGSVISYTVYGKVRRITTKPLAMTLDVVLRAD